MIICSTVDEQSPSWIDSTLENVTLEQVVEKVKVRAGFGPGFGDKAKDVVEAYAKAFPGKKPVEIWSLVSSNRQSAVALADAKSKQPARVYIELVRLAAAAVRQPPARLPLHRHLLLVPQHRPDADATPAAARARGSWRPRWPARCCSSWDRRSQRRRASDLAEVHDGQGGDHDPRRRVGGEERPRRRGAKGAARALIGDRDRRNYWTATRYSWAPCSGVAVQVTSYVPAPGAYFVATATWTIAWSISSDSTT